MHEPRVLKEHCIKVDVTENRELVWLDGKERQIESEGLADHIVMILMHLISRANLGKVSSARHYSIHAPLNSRQNVPLGSLRRALCRADRARAR